MFEDKITECMYIIGMSEDAFLSLLRDETYLSDHKIFCISRFINKINPNIFLTKKIGNLSIKCKCFEIAIIYSINTKNKCNIVVDFDKFDLIVEYEDIKLIIDQNLLDYRGEKNDLINLRQEVLNEILIRYFAKILMAIYLELRWYLL